MMLIRRDDGGRVHDATNLENGRPVRYGLRDPETPASAESTSRYWLKRMLEGGAGLSVE